jgi:oligoendopeptidase F
MFQRNPAWFVPRYTAMMRNGFNAPPAAILRKFLGLNLQDPRLVSDTFGLLEGKIKALKALYEMQ